MTDDNELMDWDDPVSDGDGSDFVLLPAGDYPYVIQSVMRGSYEGSAKLPACKAVEVTIDIDGGTNGTKTLTERFFLVKRLSWKVAELFRSIGMKRKGDDNFVPNWPQAEGSFGTCKVKIENYTDKNGDIKQTNRIDKFLDPVASPAPAPVQQPSAQQPQQAPAFTPGSF